VSPPITNSLSALRIKPEALIDAIADANLPFIEDPNFSVDDLYLTLSILTDLSEQIWAAAKAGPSDIKSFVNSVSRPYSAFNRLGSFLAWGSTSYDQQALHLAEQGLIMKENMTVSHFQNPAVEMPDLSLEQLLSQSYLREHLGQSNRHINAQITENVPIWKTLNYLGANELARIQDKESSILDVIPSVNNDFFLVGNTNGTFSVYNSSLSITESRKFNMFDLDKKA
jgi:hypothetical protein